MHILGEGFLDVLKCVRTSEGEEEEVPAREVPVINIHPALFGQFDGAHAIERGFEAFQRGEVDKLGVMVHRVIKEVDRGKPLVERTVEVIKGEPIEAYEERLHKVEWEIIVEATRMVLGEVI
jgi:phosphoribosylglycinamide formyltransferase